LVSKTFSFFYIYFVLLLTNGTTYQETLANPPHCSDLRALAFSNPQRYYALITKITVRSKYRN